MMDHDCVDHDRSSEALGGDERLKTFARPLAVISGSCAVAAFDKCSCHGHDLCFRDVEVIQKMRFQRDGGQNVRVSPETISASK